MTTELRVHGEICAVETKRPENHTRLSQTELEHPEQYVFLSSMSLSEATTETALFKDTRNMGITSLDRVAGRFARATTKHSLERSLCATHQCVLN